MPWPYPILGAARKSYPHNLCLGTQGVPIATLQWCKDHCQGDCGWWFRSNHAYLGFDLPEDLMMFSLCLDSTEHA